MQVLDYVVHYCCHYFHFLTIHLSVSHSTYMFETIHILRLIPRYRTITVYLLSAFLLRCASYSSFAQIPRSEHISRHDLLERIRQFGDQGNSDRQAVGYGLLCYHTDHHYDYTNHTNIPALANDIQHGLFVGTSFRTRLCRHTTTSIVLAPALPTASSNSTD